jgi:hypothetical protein
LYTEKENLKDTLIAHDNVDELRAAYDSGKKSAIKPNEEFGL